MTPKEKPIQLADILIDRWEQAGTKMAALAEAIPEEEYETRPIDGVRTVGEVVRHVAFWNLYVADSARGKNADGSANELPKAEYPTKAQALTALGHSVAEVARALREAPAAIRPQIAEMIVAFLEHGGEHYGQLVVYARLKGIVPPTSR
jgi:uncharacterized damage-inducible protein DinB